ncbi:uncharacterized protein Dwil_GK25007 [Drosophila willistoni]|uniref:Uncharacterized protein n=1 Tax=Drosophila willistoni TaxID=7260 RepID=B4NCX1_DROWI|nr:uncharacterized protein LOC6649063 [Drosophila willistoni]EDW82680.2 uncharacterized protein Dwil_GK25007 [Drosophila willistoni]
MAKFVLKTKMLGAAAAETVKRVARAKMNASTNMSATVQLVTNSVGWVNNRSTRNTYGTGLNMRSVYGDSLNMRTETQQRQQKLQENLESLRLINMERPKIKKDYRMPYVKPIYPVQKKKLSDCTSIEEVLNFTTEPTELAGEVISLKRQLGLEKKKSRTLLNQYRNLEGNWRSTDDELKYKTLGRWK